MRNDFEQNYLSHHGIVGMKWGIRNGPPYPLESDKLADQVEKLAKLKEPQITKDVTAVAKACGSSMYGTKNKLKTYESIKRKIDTDAEEKGITPFKAAKSIKDAVRYTAISSDKDFVANYNKFKYLLEAKGYKETKCKNYWDLYRKGKAKHKSVQCNFKTIDGYEFEVQFHTPSSQKAKNEKIPIYEERRKPNIDPDRAIYLEKQMEKLAEQVSTPDYIYKIKSH